MISIFKSALKSALSKFGYVIAQEHRLPSPERFVEVIRFHNLIPATVFDVGVAYGTPWLYNNFPNAKFHLIDPTQESLPHMEKLASQIDATIHNFALGASPEQMTIRNRDTIIHSTFMEDLTNPNIESEYTVQVKRFDEVFTNFQRPCLCKIDVEGSEMYVLEGMEKQIKNIDFFISKFQSTHYIRMDIVLST